ncbi:MAG: glycosyltransferase family 9 protein [Pseudomonadota bacterium]
MKILAVQLLRMGDILMTAPALASLRLQHPDAEIHLLINRSCKKIASLLEDVDRIHFFDRELLQKSLGDPNQSLLLAHDQLAERVLEWSCEDYDLMINFTQNRLSAHLCSVIKAKQKVGMHYSQSEMLQFNSFWLSQLNREEAELADGRLHFSDLFQLATGTAQFVAGRLKAADSAATIHPGQLVIQATTSDPQKDFPEQVLREFLRQLDKKQSGIERIVLLGAPYEEARLKEILTGLEFSSLEIALECCSFSRAKQVIESSALMLTVDTSTKHIAGFTDTPIVELALGWSDRFRTGAYQDGALIVSSPVGNLSGESATEEGRSAGLCAEQLSAIALVDIVLARITGREIDRELVARADLKVEQVCFDAFGFWCLKPVVNSAYRELFELQIARAKAQMRIDESTGFQVGHLSFLLKEFCAESLPASVQLEFKRFLASRITNCRKEYRETERQLLEVDRQKLSPLAVIGPVIQITADRRRAFELKASMKRTQSELKLVESLDQQLMEYS